MTVNDVLAFKAAQRDAIVNLKAFWASEQQQLNFDALIYIHYGPPLYSAGTVITVSVRYF